MCPGHNDANDVDADGIPDACDELIDSDGDTIADWLDNCPTIANQDQANHDSDLYGMSAMTMTMGTNESMNWMIVR